MSSGPTRTLLGGNPHRAPEHGLCGLPAVGAAVSAPDVELAVRAALHYLERASDSWRSGDPRESGPLHWPTAIAFATRELRNALEASQRGNEAAELPLVEELLCAHCGGTGFEGDDPCAFCDAVGRDALGEDARAGMAWFNGLSPGERSYWLTVAESARPADAWRAFKTREGG